MIWPEDSLTMTREDVRFGMATKGRLLVRAGYTAMGGLTLQICPELALAEVALFRSIGRFIEEGIEAGGQVLLGKECIGADEIPHSQQEGNRSHE